MLVYKPKAAFWALNMAVILAVVKVVEYTIEVAIFPINVLSNANRVGSQAM